MTHTPEPWNVGWENTLCSGGSPWQSVPLASPWVEDTWIQDDATDESKANARRIVAAVNATAGISTDALEAGAVQELVEALETASGCIVDLLMGDDGQAHKEGRKTLRKLSAALAKVQP